MEKHPRVCVISSGIGRFFKRCSDLFHEQLQQTGVQIDFHGLFWEPLDQDGLSHYTKNFRKSEVHTSPIRLFNPCEITAQKAPETNVGNFFSMAWGRYLLCRKMIDSGGFNRYDIFIYARPDVCLSKPINIAALKEYLTGYDILVPKNGHHRNGMNDQFCIANRQVAAYLSLFEFIPKYINDGVLLHPETMLKHHIATCGVRVAAIQIDSVIFRGETEFQLG
jgi:hypothetical protein